MAFINLSSASIPGFTAASKFLSAAGHIGLTLLHPTSENIDICFEGFTGHKVLEKTTQGVYQSTKAGLSITRRVVYEDIHAVGRKTKQAYLLMKSAALRAKELYPAFSRGDIGRSLESNARLFLGDVFGGHVGYLFPEATISYSISSNVANRVLANSPHKFFKAQAMGAAGFLTAIVATPIFGEYGTVMGCIITTAGSVVGGHEGRKLLKIQEAAPRNAVRGSRLDSYPVKRIQSLAAQGVALAARNLSPLSCVPIGYSMQLLAGYVSYHARYFYQIATAVRRTDAVIENLNPAHLVNRIAIKSFGSISNLIEQLTLDENGVSPVPRPLRFIASKAINEEFAVNAFVRLLNQYAEIIQNPVIAQQLNLMQQFPGFKKQWTDSIKAMINAEIEKTYGMTDIAILTPIGAVISEEKIRNVAVKLALTLMNMEKKKTGFVISDFKKNIDLLMLHAKCFLPLLANKMFQSLFVGRNTGALNAEEIAAFYENIGSMAMAPYKDNRLMSIVGDLSAVVIPGLLEEPLAARAINGAVDVALDDIEPRPVAPQRSVMEYLLYAAKLALYAIVSIIIIAKLGSRVINIISHVPSRISSFLQQRFQATHH